MQTKGAFFADTPHGGGWLWYSALNQFGIFSGGVISANLVMTRNALGDYSFNRTAAGAETYVAVIDLAEMKRLQVYPETALGATPASNLPFQEQFGAAAGTAGYPAPAAGIPPFTGANQLVAPTTVPPKGIRINNIIAVYQVGVVALTSASVTIQRTVYANNVANSITAIAATGTAPTATQANPYVFTEAVTTPVFEVADLSALSIEFNFVMANTGTIRVYGMGVHLDFNYD